MFFWNHMITGKDGSCLATDFDVYICVGSSIFFRTNYLQCVYRLNSHLYCHPFLLSILLDNICNKMITSDIICALLFFPTLTIPFYIHKISHSHNTHTNRTPLMCFCFVFWSIAMTHSHHWLQLSLGHYDLISRSQLKKVPGTAAESPVAHSLAQRCRNT